MGHDLPMFTAVDIVKVLEQLGFQVRELGSTSHRRYIHPDGRRTTIPFHSGQNIGRGLLRKIIRDLELSPKEFKELL
ncbi:MAG TPA: type II toxin-antitoxin system HicA family toxin [Candidatus Hydrogenedentes bacterium]|jgi:predicted RNA binding protein YcfA (HicA-like mRNA interferase family)|nr:MAG: YcfA-like protein [Candidatus Hydrogenedentes bacterium ADurb.Bin101]HQN01746.1 type II toxin-antitoxin system HicA family toxin [Candidatus Hydrogenedentota bacterium]